MSKKSIPFGIGGDVFIDDETLPLCTFPGGYPVVYYTHDGDILCAVCAQEWREDVIAADNYLEGPPLSCDGRASGCQKIIESAYGDPDSDDGDE